eukprot:gene48507-65817_t
MNTFRMSVACLLLAGLGGCAASRPVLYPNQTLNQSGKAALVQGLVRVQHQTLNQSGKAAGDAAIQDCRRKADAANVDDPQAGAVAKSTGVGAAVGAATGAAVG